jgi:hypothetical protein
LLYFPLGWKSGARGQRWVVAASLLRLASMVGGNAGEKLLPLFVE